MNEVKQDRFLREKQILGCKKSGIPPLIPVSHSTWWLWQKQGKMPPGIKISKRCVVWRESDIFNFIEKGIV